MGARWMSRSVAVVAVVVGSVGVFAGGAWAAVTPGWECVPTTAGQAVVSGGTGSTPSCGTGKTAVLAPTYVASGVGGRPTVQFAAVNVQIVSGSGSTAGAVNGKGNLIIGYAENSGGFSRAGSHDLVVGANNGWKSYGEIVGGNKNQALGNFATVFGTSNTASGGSSLVAGESNSASGGAASVSGGAHNAARGADSSVTGGGFNIAAGSFTSVTGGCSNLAGTGTVSLNSTCTDTTSHPNSFAAVTGGVGSQALEIGSAVSGGAENGAQDPFASISGGCGNVILATATGPTGSSLCDTASGGELESITGGAENLAKGTLASITGGVDNTASSLWSSVTGGDTNTARNTAGSVSGGFDNTASGHDSSVSGGEFNIAADEFSWIGAGCDNLTGFETANTSGCDPGGEAILGGAKITLTGTDTHSP